MSDGPTRRRVLAGAAAGLGALAGCNRLAKSTESTTPSVDPAARRRVAALGSPTIPWRLPVPVDEAALAARRNHVRTLLATVPESPAIPNGAVRSELLERRAAAVDALERAADDETGYGRLSSLRWARVKARNAHATMAAIRGELTREDVRGRRSGIREGVQTFRARWRYVGDDAERAVVVHAELESLVRRVAGRLDGTSRGREASGVLAVGDAAERLELAAAALADARYLYDRHRGRLARERRLGDAIERTARELVASVSDRRERLKPFREDPEAEFGRELVGTPAAALVRDAPRGARWATERARRAFDGGRPATALRAAGRADRAFRAFESVRSAVARGDYDDPATASTLREAKLDALAAVERARTETASRLADAWLRSAVSDVDGADRRLTEGDPTESAVEEAIAAYVWCGARAGRTAAALAWTRGALAAAAGE